MTTAVGSAWVCAFINVSCIRRRRWVGAASRAGLVVPLTSRDLHDGQSVAGVTIIIWRQGGFRRTVALFPIHLCKLTETKGAWTVRTIQARRGSSSASLNSCADLR